MHDDTVAARNGNNVTSLVPLYCCKKRFQYVYILCSEKGLLAPEQME